MTYHAHSQLSLSTMEVEDRLMLLTNPSNLYVSLAMEEDRLMELCPNIPPLELFLFLTRTPIPPS